MREVARERKGLRESTHVTKKRQRNKRMQTDVGPEDKSTVLGALSHDS